jgi:putative flippase GtrA
MKLLFDKLVFPGFFSKTIINEGLKYILVGGLCTIIDFILLYILTEDVGLSYLPSSIISFITGTVLNYFLCTIWIFKIRVVKKRRHEFLYYILISGIGLLINTLAIWGFTEILNIYYMISKLLATLITFWWNFGARKYFLHSNK